MKYAVCYQKMLFSIYLFYITQFFRIIKQHIEDIIIGTKNTMYTGK